MLLNDPVNNHRILLIDYHGEYTGDFDKVTGYEDGKWCRVKEIWDGYALGDLRRQLGLPDDDDVVNAAFRVLYGDKLDEFLAYANGDASMIYIWEVMGEGMIRAFDHLLNALDTVPSGDDDVFDYWPNTMDMLWQFASDLDQLHTTTEHRARAHQLATKVRDAMNESVTNEDFDEDWMEFAGHEWIEWTGE